MVSRYSSGNMPVSPKARISSRYPSFQSGRASVANSGESGSGSSSTTLVRPYFPFGLGKGQSSDARGSGKRGDRRRLEDEGAAVVERPFDVHRHAVQLLDLHAQTRQLAGLGRLERRPLATVRRHRLLRVPPFDRTVIMSLSAISCDPITPVGFSMVSVSGVTCPPTIASPSPQAALIITWSRDPVIGFAVKRMPATSAGTSS